MTPSTAYVTIHRDSFTLCRIFIQFLTVCLVFQHSAPHIDFGYCILIMSYYIILRPAGSVALGMFMLVYIIF